MTSDAHTARRCIIRTFCGDFRHGSCPEQLKLVTHIATSNMTIFLHHFRHFQRVPCFIFYSPYHSSAKCGGRKGIHLVHHHRELTGVPIALPHVSGMTFNHLDVAGRLLHVSELADTLVATTKKLKAAGVMSPC